MNRTYRPHEFAKLISRTTQTLQRWDREGILKAHRSPTNRCYYTHDRCRLSRKLNRGLSVVVVTYLNPSHFKESEV